MVPQSIKNYRCIQSITTTYADRSGVCGDSCCGGIYLGEETYIFEVDEIYELEVSNRYKTYLEVQYVMDNYNIVDLNFDTQEEMNEYFIEVAEHE
jgi:hypothetical protein